eukprot:13417651-Ditylum_brightwellii.AAC.1
MEQKLTGLHDKRGISLFRLLELTKKAICIPSSSPTTDMSKKKRMSHIIVLPVKRPSRVTAKEKARTTNAVWAALFGGS